MEIHGAASRTTARGISFFVAASESLRERCKRKHGFHFVFADMEEPRHRNPNRLYGNNPECSDIYISFAHYEFGSGMVPYLGRLLITHRSHAVITNWPGRRCQRRSNSHVGEDASPRSFSPPDKGRWGKRVAGLISHLPSVICPCEFLPPSSLPPSSRLSVVRPSLLCTPR